MDNINNIIQEMIEPTPIRSEELHVLDMVKLPYMSSLGAHDEDLFDSLYRYIGEEMNLDMTTILKGQIIISVNTAEAILAEYWKRMSCKCVRNYRLRTIERLPTIVDALDIEDYTLYYVYNRWII